MERHSFNQGVILGYLSLNRTCLAFWTADPLTTRPPSANMQVTHSYGAKPNEDFLQFYGFVDIDNVNDAYTADLLHWVLEHFEAGKDNLKAAKGHKGASKLLQKVNP